MRNAGPHGFGVPEMNFKILLKHINNIKKKSVGRRGVEPLLLRGLKLRSPRRSGRPVKAARLPPQIFPVQWRHPDVFTE